MKLTIILLALLFSCVACNSEQQATDKVASNEADTTTETQQSTTKQSTTTQSAAEQDEKIAQLTGIDLKLKYLADKSLAGADGKSRSVQINGEKYLTSSQQLIKGSKVFSLLMKETGTIKGSIVIVTNQLNQAELDQRFALSSVVKIAQDTFRLIPKDETKLYAMYQEMTAASDISVTELEIDFSGQRAERESY